MTFVSGCSSFRQESIESHLVSQGHQVACKADQVDEEPSAASLQHAVLRMSDEMAAQLKLLFNTAYYAVKERPLSDFVGLVEL